MSKLWRKTKLEWDSLIPFLTLLWGRWVTKGNECHSLSSKYLPVKMRILVRLLWGINKYVYFIYACVTHLQRVLWMVWLSIWLSVSPQWLVALIISTVNLRLFLETLDSQLTHVLWIVACYLSIIAISLSWKEEMFEQVNLTLHLVRSFLPTVFHC